MKTIKQLENELIELRKSNEWAWNHYGSELCAGDMIGKEEKLEKEIRERKAQITKIKETPEINE